MHNSLIVSLIRWSVGTTKQLFVRSIFIEQGSLGRVDESERCSTFNRHKSTIR